MKFSIDLDDFSTAAICISLLAIVVGYEYTHRTFPPVPAPAPVAPAPITMFCPPPTITIKPTVYVPAPKVIEIAPETTPEISPDSDPVDEKSQRTVILTSEGPKLFPPRKGVTIPESLRQ